jgi:hypothetical protein
VKKIKSSKAIDKTKTHSNVEKPKLPDNNLEKNKEKSKVPQENIEDIVENLINRHEPIP